MEIVMPLSMNLLGYNTVDEAMLCQKCQKYQISVHQLCQKILNLV